MVAIGKGENLMETWLLRLCIAVPGEPPWVTYETTHLTLVVTAETEDEARAKADKYEEDEHRGKIVPEGVEHPWLSPQYSTVTKLS